MPPSLPSHPAPEPLLPAIPVIVNPKARSARAGARLADIQALSPLISLQQTTSMGDARQIAETLARAGVPLIVAAGGDGTVNEVVNGIVRAGTADRTVLGVLPTGTMNVFAAEMGLPSARLDECWNAITGGEIREVDLWRLNDSFFIQLAGVGLDAAIIEGTTWESKKRFGPFSYLMSGSRLLARGAPLLTVRREGHPEVTGTVVLIGNGRNYGGPFPLFPFAVPGDGLLDVVVMPFHGLREFYAVGHALVSGHYAPARGVHYFQTDRLQVEAVPEAACEVDGELADPAGIFNICREGTLRVMTPRGWNPSVAG